MQVQSIWEGGEDPPSILLTDNTPMPLAIHLNSVQSFFHRFINYAGLVLFAISCTQKQSPMPAFDAHTMNDTRLVRGDSMFIKIPRDVRIKDYFKFMDSLAKRSIRISGSHLSEYQIVHANPWILDSLRNSDYYVLKQRGVFQYDQREDVILHRGDCLVMPDSSSAIEINAKMKSTTLDVNIPEYKLRIIQSGDTILTCKVRVGKPVAKYLTMVGHEINFRTVIGVGKIVRIERDPYYINPDDGKRYDSTMRDDGKYTKMPIIPWMEPSINGIRYGDMIHATTNISTLGKAYSHGCVGTSEADAWMIYYNSPIGTTVVFRYDLLIKNKKGDSVQLEDIYNF